MSIYLIVLLILPPILIILCGILIPVVMVVVNILILQLPAEPARCTVANFQACMTQIPICAPGQFPVRATQTQTRKENTHTHTHIHICKYAK